MGDDVWEYLSSYAYRIKKDLRYKCTLRYITQLEHDPQPADKA